MARYRKYSRACLENLVTLINMSVTLDDKVIGNNLKTLRGSMSQEELASKMRDSGFKWSKATVWSVEQGQRPLRLTEARAVLICLGQTSLFAMNKLLSVSTLAAISMFQESVNADVDEILEILDRILDERINLAFKADEAIQSDEGLPGAIEMSVAEALRRSIPENIFKEYLTHELYERRKEKFEKDFYDKFDPSTMTKAIYEQTVQEAEKDVPEDKVLHGLFLDALSDNERLEDLADPANYHRVKETGKDNDGVDS